MIFSIKSHIDRLCEQSKVPESEAHFEAWIRLENAIDILQADIGQNELVVYAGLGYTTFMHAVVVPISAVKSSDVEVLCSWNFNASNCWGISWTFSDPPVVSVVPPLSDDYLEGAEQLVFLRSFEGYIGDQNYVEILQKITHIFGLHWGSRAEGLLSY